MHWLELESSLKHIEYALVRTRFVLEAHNYSMHWLELESSLKHIEYALFRTRFVLEAHIVCTG